jgi:hypothetical protein
MPAKPSEPNSRASRHRAGCADVARRLLRTACCPVVAVVALTVVATPVLAATTEPTQGGAAPFASGTLASLSGSTLDITNTRGDTKVIVNSSTKYQETKTVDASAVTVGECIRVTGTGSASKGIAANSVAVSAGTSKCTQSGGPGRTGAARGGFRNPNGNGPGSSGTGPSGSGPSGSGPSGSAPPGGVNGSNRNGQGFPTNLGMISGKVKSVSGDTVVVKGTVFQLSRTSNSRPKTTTKTVKVTVASSARITQSVAATADVLTVGSCVNAAGTTDSVGTVTAKTVTISQAENGSCGGFGFGRGFGAGPTTA